MNIEHTGISVLYSILTENFELCIFGTDEVLLMQVNSRIINMAAAVYEFDFRVNKHTDFLCYGGEKLQEVSQIDTQNWDPLKLATALKLIACPGGCEEVNLNAK
jgi:nucleolar protein 58